LYKAYDVFYMALSPLISNFSHLLSIRAGTGAVYKKGFIAGGKEIEERGKEIFA
jgi:hypothetical protein